MVEGLNAATASMVEKKHGKTPGDFVKWQRLNGSGIVLLAKEHHFFEIYCHVAVERLLIFPL